VNDYLEKIDSGGEHGKVHVRTLFIGKKSFTMRDELARELKKEDPDVETEFPYTVKVIFAWEEIDDTPVCFWGLHVQEYGSDTADPNKRRVYISYLDSVFFFRPKRLRTEVYHEILISYLEYCRQLGFFWGHIWACPPSEGDDYIFHCHPEAQKVPKPKRLQEWYKKMLEKAEERRVIEKFDSILAHAKNQESDEPYKTMAYFDGDFWPNAIEDMVKEVDTEKIEREKQEAEEAQEEAKLKEISEQGDCDQTVSQPGPDGKNPSKKNSSNKMKKTKNKKKKNAKEKEHSYKNDLCAKMFGQLERYADMFFVIQLQTDDDMRNPTPIKDPDEPKANELMDGRDPFLCMAREKHWEFSSLRRSKWSSIEFLFELHNTEKAGSDGYTCNICQTKIEGIRWNCKTCEDYDICDKCKKAKSGALCGHELQSQDAVDERKQNWNKYIKALEHASTCRNTNCKIAHCQRMRKLIGHTRECKQRAGGCTLCRQLVMLCCHHAKTCKNDSCTIPYCSKIKDKFKQQQGRNNQRNLRALQQRAQLMNNGGAPRPVQSSSSSEVKEETSQSSYTGNGNPGTPGNYQPPTPGNGAKGGGGGNKGSSNSKGMQNHGGKGMQNHQQDQQMQNQQQYPGQYQNQQGNQHGNQQVHPVQNGQYNQNQQNNNNNPHTQTSNTNQSSNQGQNQGQNQAQNPQHPHNQHQTYPHGHPQFGQQVQQGQRYPNPGSVATNQFRVAYRPTGGQQPASPYHGGNPTSPANGYGGRPPSQPAPSPGYHPVPSPQQPGTPGNPHTPGGSQVQQHAQAGGQHAQGAGQHIQVHNVQGHTQAGGQHAQGYGQNTQQPQQQHPAHNQGQATQHGQAQNPAHNQTAYSSNQNTPQPNNQHPAGGATGNISNPAQKTADEIHRIASTNSGRNETGTYPNHQRPPSHPAPTATAQATPTPQQQPNSQSQTQQPASAQQASTPQVAQQHPHGQVHPAAIYRQPGTYQVVQPGYPHHPNMMYGRAPMYMYPRAVYPAGYTNAHTQYVYMQNQQQQARYMYQQPRPGVPTQQQQPGHHGHQAVAAASAAGQNGGAQGQSQQNTAQQGQQGQQPNHYNQTAAQNHAGHPQNNNQPQSSNNNPGSPSSKQKMSEEIKLDLEKIFAVIKSPSNENDKHEQIKKILKGNVKLVGIFLKKTRGGQTGDPDLDKSLSGIPEQYLRSAEAGFQPNSGGNSNYPQGQNYQNRNWQQQQQQQQQQGYGQQQQHGQQGQQGQQGQPGQQGKQQYQQQNNQQQQQKPQQKKSDLGEIDNFINDL